MDDFRRVCPKCGRSWISRHAWESDVTPAELELVDVGSYKDVRDHKNCGGKMYAPGLVSMPPVEKYGQRLRARILEEGQREKITRQARGDRHKAGGG